MKSMLTVEQAREEILNGISTLPAQHVPLFRASGLFLAEDIICPIDVPAFHNAAIDGYAFRWEDLSGVRKMPLNLRVVADIPAGVLPEEVVGPKEAARIMTGAVLPQGVNTVVRKKNTNSVGELISINKIPSKGYGANIRRKGTFMKRGEVVARVGQKITAGEIALLSSFGMTMVSVYSRPRVAVISTGDELVEIGTVPEPGEVVNSSGVMLAELIRQAGGIPVVTPFTPDRRELIRARFQEALAISDVVVSIGGMSVGERDLVRSVMEAITGEIAFWKVKVRPGKPLAFGLADGVPLIGVPGNPLSSFVSFYQFVRPALLGMQGARELVLKRVQATLTKTVNSDPRRREYKSGQVFFSADGSITFESVENQSAGNMRLLSGINGFGIFEEGREFFAMGERIPVELIPE